MQLHLLKARIWYGKIISLYFLTALVYFIFDQFFLAKLIQPYTRLRHPSQVLGKPKKKSEAHIFLSDCFFPQAAKDLPLHLADMYYVPPISGNVSESPFRAVWDRSVSMLVS